MLRSPRCGDTLLSDDDGASYTTLRAAWWRPVVALEGLLRVKIRFIRQFPTAWRKSLAMLLRTKPCQANRQTLSSNRDKALQWANEDACSSFMAER